MGNNKVQIKINSETHKNLKRLINFKEIELDRDITISEILEDLIENEMEQYDKKRIVKVKS